jgi:hypothetical protein
MSTTMTREADGVIQPQQDTFREERDALLPRPGYVIIPGDPDEGTQDEYLKIPRLNMRRTLRLSQWLDVVGSRDEVQKSLADLSTAMSTGNEGPGLAYVFTINKFISSLDLPEALELFSIITAKSPEWLDDRWEIGWGIEAMRVAFRQQGFQNLFNAAGGEDAVAGENEVGKTEEVSAPQSISSSPNMGGQMTPFSN